MAHRQLVHDLDLAEEIDQRLHLFKIHLPYHESDHVLNLAFSAYCGSRCLEDLELLRQDEAYLNLVGAARIPDPTTAGDFCCCLKSARAGRNRALLIQRLPKIVAGQIGFALHQFRQRKPLRPERLAR